MFYLTGPTEIRFLSKNCMIFTFIVASAHSCCTHHLPFN
uniref:Uncharacterized protein n=1 Tax=Anguilla anguilla TaxID=7936 RepID=A0A0E9QWF6_ANGAN